MKRLMIAGLCVAFAALALASTGQANVWTVAPGGGGGSFTTIQAAINAAASGDTINVLAGTYNEAIVMNKPLNLIGHDSSDTFITYTNVSNKIEQNFFLGSNTGTDFNQATLIENFTFLNGGALKGDNDLLKFRARGAGGQIVIRNNIFDGNSSTSVKAIEEAYGASNFLVQGNEFTGLRYGMYLNNAHDGDVADNTFTGMSSGAIGLNPDPDAFYVPGGVRNIDITGNTMTGGNFGILLGDGNQSVTITMNRILNNTGTYGAGILYWDDEGSHNPATEFETDDILITVNDIVGNGVGIRGYVDPADPPKPQNVIDARGNWWGNASGPSGGVTDPWTAALANGSGDSILLKNVAFDAWRTSPIPEPATLALLALGGVGMLLSRRRGK